MGCGCYTLFARKVIHNPKNAHKQTEDSIPGILRLLLGCYFTAPFLYQTQISMGQQHSHKQTGNNPGAAFHLFDVTAENADDNVRNQAEGNAVGDVVCKGHYRQGQKCGIGNGQIVPVNIFHGTQHQKAYIDQRGGCGAAGL